MKKKIIMNATTARKNFFQLLRDVGQHHYTATIIHSDTGTRFNLDLEEKTSVVNKKDLIKEWDNLHMDLIDLKTLKKIILDGKTKEHEI